MNGSRTGRFLSYTGNKLWRFRLRLGVLLGFILAITLFYATRTYLAPFKIVDELT